MGAGKNKAHRKNRISKHVQDSQKRHDEDANSGQKQQEGVVPPPNSAASKTTAAPRKKKGKKNRNVKDPKEAASYLSSWKHKEAGTNWKFNKNTQSWLIRHMYQADLVDKTTFGLLLEYLGGGDERLHARVQEDATKRALRYKEYEKTAENKKEGSQEGDDKSKDNKDANSEEEYELKRWNALNDHDKRKEYKRARKVLDTLKTKE